MQRINRKTWLVFMVVAGLLYLQGSGYAQDAAKKGQIVKNGDVIEINYVGKLKDDTVFDKTEGRGPFKFTVGSSNIIKGMSNGVLGMKVGEKKTAAIPSAEAYGEYDDKKLVTVPLKNLPPGIKAGATISNLQGQILVVKEVSAESAVLDANHLLAGKTLIFDIELLSIQ